MVRPPDACEVFCTPRRVDMWIPQECARRHRCGPLWCRPYPRHSASPRKDEEILFRKEIDFLDLTQADCIHPAGHLGLRNNEIRLPLVRTLFGFKVDHHETAISFEIAGSVLHIAGPIFDVMK